MFPETIRDLYAQAVMRGPDINTNRTTAECNIMNELYEDLKCLDVKDLEQLKGYMNYRMVWFHDNPEYPTLTLESWKLAIYQINETIRRKTNGDRAWL